MTRHINITTLPQDCTWDLCSFETHNAPYFYRPSLALNGFLLAAFALSLVVHIGQGIRYRTWTFLIAMGFGGLGEVIGYIGRIMSHNNPWNEDAFLTQIVCLTIAPAFFAAAIYLCLSRIVTIYGAGISRMPPVYYTRLFIACDFVSLVLQAAGGGIASSSTKEASNEPPELGTHIMLAGVAFQVFTLSLFISMCAEFAFRVWRAREDHLDARFAVVRRSSRFKVFLALLAASTVFILIRSIFRLIEMAQGWSGALAQNQTLFFVLEGVMVLLAVMVLNVWHPGMAMREAYHDAKAGKEVGDVEMKGMSGSTPSI